MLIIGGGISGMTAALLLARLGHKVKIIEKHRLGVLMDGFVRDGLHFDTGFHYAGGLHTGGILETWLKYLEIWGLCCFEPMEAELYRQEGSTLLLPPGHQAGSAALDDYFPGYKNKVQAFFQAMDQILAKSAYTNPHSASGTIHTLSLSNIKLIDYLNELNLPEKLKQILSIRCLLYGIMPEQAGFAEFSMVAGPFFQSSHSLVGGGRSLVKAFKQILTKYNVEIICNKAVDKFELDAEKKVKAVLLGQGEEIAVSQCIFTGHPQQLEKMLPPKSLRPAYFTRIRHMEESFYGFMLFAESESNFLDKRSIFIMPDQNIQGLEENKPVIYISSSHQGGKRRAITALALLKNMEHLIDYSAWKQALTHKMSKHVLEYCPELAAGFKILESATPVSFKHWSHGCNGSLYGLAHNQNNLPISPATKIPNLFLAGQHILLPGVLGAIISGSIAAGFIAGHEQILGGLCTE